MDKNTIQQLRDFALFKDVPGQKLQKHEEIFSRRKLKKGSFVIFESDPGRNFYIILKGKVKIIISSITGRKKVLAILKQGDFFGELSLFTNLPTSASVQAVEACTLLMIEKKDFETFLAISPKIPLNIIENLCHRLFRTDKQVGELIFASVQHRTIRFLVQSIEHTKGDTAIIEFDINQKEIADIIGTSRELVSRVLTRLKRQGLIDYKSLKRVKILSVSRLREFLKM